ncbi:MCE family protein [Nocardioides sp. L-11A]|uniref:MCE family protein n=1 Tax=Nocardioides sp. L-11A TaxID=3043848 RepID=UPI00249BCA91|nr:MCE family protein [Nocardioides sp. L-11A]
MRLTDQTTAKRGRPALVAGALIAAVTVSGCSLSLQDMPKPGGLSEETYSVTASFDDVLNLPANAEVRDGARVVGEVGTMKVDGYRAEVELRFISGVEIPTGTTVEVRFDNPLGDQFVEIHRPTEGGGGGALLRDGDTLDAEDTAAAPTVEDTLGAFATVLTGGGVGDLHSISRELNAVFSGNEPQIKQLLARLAESAELLAGGLGPIDRALDEVARLSKQLDDNSDVLVDGIEAISPAIGVLADLNDDFTTLLEGLDGFAAAGNQIIARSGRQTVRALKRLVPVVQQIVDSRELITPMIKNIRTLADQVPQVTAYGYARTSVAAQLDFSSAPSTASGTVSGRLSGRPPATSLMTPLGPLESGRLDEGRQP